MQVMLLPPEFIEAQRSVEEKILFIDPMSRRQWRIKCKWGYKLLTRIEQIAYWSIPLYRQGIYQTKLNRMGGELTGYHQWVLLFTRQVWDTNHSDDRTAELIQSLEQSGYLTHAAFRIFIDRFLSEDKEPDSPGTIIQIQANLN